MSARFRGILRLASALLAGWGCGPRGECICVEPGFVSVVSRDRDSHVVVNDQYNSRVIHIDLGLGPLWQPRAEALLFSNIGSSDMTVIRVSTDGDETEFWADVPEGQVLVAGGLSVPVGVHFLPRTPGPRSGRILLSTDSDLAPTIEIYVTGQSAGLGLDVRPQSVDFGGVGVGTTRWVSLSLTNRSSIPIAPTLGGLSGSDPLLFLTEPPAGSALPLAQGETRSIAVAFSPLVASPTVAQAEFTIQFCDAAGPECSRIVRLMGTAVSSCVALTPDTVDFGFVPPGHSASAVVKATNICHQGPAYLVTPPALVNLGADGSTSATGPFQRGAGYPEESTTIDEGEALQFSVAFTPTDLGEFSGELGFTRDSAVNVHGQITLHGFGGGPAISCSPSALDFGPHPVGSRSRLEVTCTNVGTDIPGNPWVRLWVPDPNAGDPGLVIASGEATFQALFGSPLSPTGLAAGESMKIEVVFAPTTAGPSTDTLQFYSNDTSHPLETISLTGVGE